MYKKFFLLKSLKIMVVLLLLWALTVPVYAEGTWLSDAKTGYKVWYYGEADSAATFTWTGGYKNGYVDGRGVLKLFFSKISSTYEGTYVMGKLNGEAVETWSDGERYEGNWKDGMHSGHGVVYTKGSHYEGEFENGMNVGKAVGSYTYPDGKNLIKYDGEWYNSFPSGKGTMIYANGGRYEGEWKNGNRSGQGTYLDCYKRLYDGEWMNNKRNGRGHMSYPNGEQYSGEWSDGAPSGNGVLIYANGDRYEGGWKYGMRYGYGVLSNGSLIKKGWFIHDQFFSREDKWKEKQLYLDVCKTMPRLYDVVDYYEDVVPVYDDED